MKTCSILIMVLATSRFTLATSSKTSKLAAIRNHRVSSSFISLRGGSSESTLPSTIDDVRVNYDNVITTTYDYKLGPNAAPPGFFRQSFPTFPWHRVPNMISILRCLLIPALIVLFYQPNSHVATSILFALTSVTDWIDGYLARRWDIVSPLGALLDTIADKLMVSTTLILLTGRYGMKVAVPTAIIVSREIAVTALREWMAQRNLSGAVKVQMGGKVKTAVTMISLTILLLVPSPSRETDGVLLRLYQPGLVMLYLCALLTLSSGNSYFQSAVRAVSSQSTA